MNRLRLPQTPFVLGAKGCVAVPQGPGLGIELDASRIKTIMRRLGSEQRG